MSEYYVVIETLIPYERKKRAFIANTEVLNETTINRWKSQYEEMKNLCQNSTIITFIQKLESEDEDE